MAYTDKVNADTRIVCIIVVEVSMAQSFNDEGHKNIELLVARSVHELRSPLGSLRNILRWLQVQLKNYHENPRVLVKLQDAFLDVEALRQIIDGIDLYRNSASSSEVKTKIFGDVILKNLTDLNARLSRLGTERSAIVVETEGVNEIPPLRVNRASTAQIISNLIDNAVKYRNMDQPFRLKFIGENRAPDHYSIRIQDWGIGVPDGLEERIFEDNVRASNAQSQNPVGMGLGLFISRELAHRMGGDLRLERNSHPTEFVLSFPKELAQ